MYPVNQTNLSIFCSSKNFLFFQTVTVRWFYVCSVFCPASTDDEARDLANQKRIRSFHWITPQHLDAAINPDSDKVQQLIEDAQQGNIPVSWLKVCLI